MHVDKILNSLRSVFCTGTREALNDLPEPAKSEAIKYGVSNGLSIGRAAKEFGVDRAHVAEVCRDLDTVRPRP